MSPWKNQLFFGDNLDILRSGRIPVGSVDLIYLDPPFNSNATYNLLFAEKSGEKSAAQITAFEDTWHWGEEAMAAYDDAMKLGAPRLAELLQALRAFLGQNDMMAYLTMMAVRLVELHRVLKPTGSLYLHCDPTASHYLKLVLDAIYGPQNFQGEIIWRRTAAHVTGIKWPRLHDVILNYAKDLKNVKFNKLKMSPDEGWIKREYRFKDERGTYMLDNLTGAGTTKGPSGLPWRGVDPSKIGAGRHWRYHPDTLDKLDSEGRIYWPENGRYPKIKQYLHETGGTAIGDLWADIQVIGRTSAERLGYPTQKPEALLERIIKASSSEGDLVLDPFCGCGTTISVAERLKRRWIGIDITYLAINLIKRRLNDSFAPEDRTDYEVIGVPADAHSAAALAEVNRHQFEWWALDLVDAAPAQDKKKGADRGVDGVIYFQEKDDGPYHKIIVQVKSGHVSAKEVRELEGTRRQEKAEIAALLTLKPPTKPMKEAVPADNYVSALFPDLSFPRVQILTIAELFAGKQLEYPRWVPPKTFKKAARRRKGPTDEERQGELL